MNARLGHRRTVTCAYTLIELLLVIVVLGLSGALLIPHLAYKDSLASQAAVRLLISDRVGIFFSREHLKRNFGLLLLVIYVAYLVTLFSNA